ncbi:MAG: CRISPR-associated endonuclease Cas1 [Pseudomonadota bacterium]|nr:CRISPR-associated endonuclease Cas1 [Pseudomonadota bacterium]
MSIIYVVSDYGRLVKRGDVLQLRKGDDLLKSIFPFKTEQLVIVGRIEITSAAINLLMRHQIDTVFLHRNGKFNGKFAFASGKNVFYGKNSSNRLKMSSLPWRWHVLWCGGNCAISYAAHHTDQER